MSSFNKLSLSQSHGTEASRLLAASPNSDTEGMTFSLFDALCQAQSDLVSTRDRSQGDDFVESHLHLHQTDTVHEEATLMVISP